VPPSLPLALLGREGPLALAGRECEIEPLGGPQRREGGVVQPLEMKGGRVGEEGKGHGVGLSTS